MDQPTVIILDKEQEPEQTSKPTFWNNIGMLIIFYAILGIICYYFNKEWFDYLYMTPYNYLKDFFKSK